MESKVNYPCTSHVEKTCRDHKSKSSTTDGITDTAGMKKDGVSPRFCSTKDRNKPQKMKHSGNNFTGSGFRNGNVDGHSFAKNSGDKATLDRAFIEELCRMNGTLGDDWIEYYDRLLSLLSGQAKDPKPRDFPHNDAQEHAHGDNNSGIHNDIRSQTCLNAQHPGSKRSNSTVTTNKFCLKCGYVKQTEDCTDSPVKNRVHFVNGACVSSLPKCACGKPSGERSSRTTPGGTVAKESAKTSTKSHLSSSEREFYRNLRYYFGSGRVKNRKAPEETESKGESVKRSGLAQACSETHKGFETKLLDLSPSYSGQKSETTENVMEKPGQHNEKEGQHKEKEGQHKEKEGQHKEKEGQPKEKEGQSKEKEGQSMEKEGQAEKKEGQHREKEGKHEKEGQHKEKEGRHKKKEGRHKEKKGQHKEKKGQNNQKEGLTKEKEGQQKEKESQQKEMNGQQKEKESRHKEKEAQHKEKDGRHKEKEGQHKEKEGQHKEKEGRHQEKEGRHKEKEGRHQEKEGRHKEKEGRHKEKEGQHKEKEGQHKEKEGQPKEKEGRHQEKEGQHKEKEGQHKEKESWYKGGHHPTGSVQRDACGESSKKVHSESCKKPQASSEGKKTPSHQCHDSKSRECGDKNKTTSKYKSQTEAKGEQHHKHSKDNTKSKVDSQGKPQKPKHNMKTKPAHKTNRKDKAKQNEQEEDLLSEVSKWLRDSGREMITTCGNGVKSVAIYAFILVMLVFGCVLYGIWMAGCHMFRKSLEYTRLDKWLASTRAKFTEWQRLRPKPQESQQWNPGRKQSYELPKSGEAAVNHMLNNKGNKDPYSVIGLPPSASDDEIKRHYRKLAVLIHPDKNPNPQAGEAFKVLANAFDILGDPKKRMTHDIKAACKKKEEEMRDRSPFHFATEDILSRVFKTMEEMANYVYCDACDTKHRRYKTDRSMPSARYCSRCDTRHSAKEGDLWAETKCLGLKLYFYACMEGHIFDVTEWAACQGIQRYHVEPNAHAIHLKIKTSQSARAGPSQSRAEDEEFEDFVRTVFGEPPSENENTPGSKKGGKKNRKKKK